MCSDRSFVLDIHTGFNWIIAVSEHLEAVWSIRQMAGNEIRFCCSAWKGFSKILCGKTEQKDSTNCLCIFHLRNTKIIMEQRNPKYLILSCSPTHWCLWQIFNIGSQLENYYRKNSTKFIEILMSMTYWTVLCWWDQTVTRESLAIREALSNPLTTKYAR